MKRGSKPTTAGDESSSPAGDTPETSAGDETPARDDTERELVAAVLGGNILGALAESAGGYQSRRADCVFSDEQTAIVNRLRAGLYESHTRLANGRQVDSNPTAIQWLLEQIHFADQQ